MSEIKVPYFLLRIGERKDYDFDFTDFLSEGGDTIQAGVVTAVSSSPTVPLGMTIETPIVTSVKVKVWITGTSAGTFTTTCTITTVGGIVEKAYCTIQVK